MSSTSLKENAVKGFKWTALERILLQGVQFAIGIVIARFVTPAEYGVVGMLAIFISLGSTIQDSGFATALIRKKNKTDIDYSTAFFFNIIVGALIYVTFFVFSGFIADFYNTPILEDVTKVYAITLFLNSLTIVQIAKLTSEYRFQVQFVINVVTTLVSGVVGIWMAVKGYGVWALVWSNIISTASRTILIWIVAKWVPLLAFSKASFSYLFSFGSRMLITSIIDVTYDNIYTLLIGKFFNQHEVGLYSRASHVVGIPKDVTNQVVSKVILPVLAPVQDDTPRLITAYERIFKSIIFIVYPLNVFLLVLAKPFILFLLGDSWGDCIPYLQIMAIGAFFVPLTYINVNLIIVKGRSDLLLKIDIYKKIIGFAVVAVAVSLGMYWICWGTAVYALFAFLINCRQTQILVGYGLVEQIKSMIPLMPGIIIMGVSSYVVTSLIDSNLLQLIIGGFVGSVVYIGYSIITKNETLKQLYNIIRRR